MTSETRLNPVMSLLAAAVLLSASFPAAAGARLSCSRAESRLLPVPDSGRARLPLVLPLDKSNSMEALSQGQPVLAEEVLPFDGWRAEGPGQLLQGGELRLLVPVSTGRRAVGQPGDEDYCTFGQVSVSKDLYGRDLRQFNRIAMDILPECRGTGVMNLNLHLGNRTYADVGAHLINLTPNEWNHVELDMSGLPRESVRSLRLYTDLKGRNLFLGDSLAYIVRNLRLLRVEHSAKEVGWDVAQGHVAYSMSGYFPGSRKTAVLGFEAARFEVVDTRTGKAVKQGRVRLEHTSIGTFRVADFTSVRREGTYVIRAGGRQTRPFRIGEDAFEASKWRVLSFIHGQRCGAAVEGVHGVCHTDLFSVLDGRRTSYAGGWHDAGDLSQQTLQSGDVAFALAEAYGSLRRKMQRGAGGADSRAGAPEAPAGVLPGDPGELARRLRDEAFHGYRFILRQRLGNGWHASSMGLLHWTDGVVGTADDITSVRVQDNSFDNFLYAAYEAYAARTFAGEPLADSLRRAAVEDFDFGRRRFEARGFDSFPHMMEHTYSTPNSLCLAAMSWSASQLYRLTGEEQYARLAAEYIRGVLGCQATGGRGLLAGFFYRDERRLSIVHSIHQSREQLFAMALAELLGTQPSHRDSGRWRRAARLHADYLKALSPFTAPYGMMASGVYRTGEWRDEDAFRRLNLFAPANAPELYEQQIREGEQVDSLHFVRRFPTWFSIFNGNEALLLASGKAAAVLGNLLGDRELLDMGCRQLYWSVGENPFCQSLIYGEGHNYPSMDSFSSGELTGEMPVGIRAKGNGDVPYWPQTNNACYKEVWVTSAGKWMSLLAEY